LIVRKIVMIAASTGTARSNPRNPKSTDISA
jgi:hypothetical protein